MPIEPRRTAFTVAVVVPTEVRKEEMQRVWEFAKGDREKGRA
jgi:hypothetical protein